MNLQRLKFAWARGARISFDGVVMSEWDGRKFTRLDIDDGEIHPDDEHLQYGPVSSAFRDMALYKDSVDLDYYTELFMDMAGSNYVLDDAWNMTNVEVDFARLFMAELLADEGL